MRAAVLERNFNEWAFVGIEFQRKTVLASSRIGKHSQCAYKEKTRRNDPARHTAPNALQFSVAYTKKALVGQCLYNGAAGTEGR